MPSCYTFPLPMRPYRSLSCDMRARRFLFPTIATRGTLSVTSVTSLVFIFDLHLLDNDLHFLVSVRKHFESFESFVIQSGDLIREGHHRCGRRRTEDVTTAANCDIRVT